MIPLNYIIPIYRIAKEWFSFPFIVVLLGIIGTTIIIKNKRKIIGYAIITGNYLHYLAVSSKHHGKGHGKRLLQKIIPLVKRLRVDVKNRKAIALYKLHGFKIKGTSNWITGRKHVMEKIFNAQ